MKKSVVIQLDYSEAVVLSSMLHRWQQGDVWSTLCFDHRAEDIALANLLCLLEPKIDEVFSDNYDQVLAWAREDLVEEDDTTDSQKES